MTFFRTAILVTAVSLTTACTTVKNWLADTPNVNRSVQKTEKLVVPEGYANPAVSEQYKLAANAKSAQGADVITSPSSILEILQGSWVNSDDKQPYKIMLEKPQQVEDFQAFLTNGAMGLVDSRGYNLLNDTNGYTIEVTKSTEVGFWLWSKTVETERFVFTLNLDMLPSGRSAAAVITPVSLEVLNKSKAPKFEAEYRKQQLAIEMLNQYSLELDYQFRVAVQKQQILNDVTLSLGTNSANNPVITSQRDISIVFKELDDILEDLGFDIEEEDKQLFSYTVNYNPENPGLWSSVFASEYAYKATLPKGKYEVVLITTIDGVHMAFTDSEGQPLNDQQVQSIFEWMIKIVKEDDIEL